MPFNQSRPRVAELAGEEDGVEDGGGFIIYDSKGICGVHAAWTTLTEQRYSGFIGKEGKTGQVIEPGPHTITEPAIMAAHK